VPQRSDSRKAPNDVPQRSDSRKAPNDVPQRSDSHKAPIVVPGDLLGRWRVAVRHPHDAHGPTDDGAGHDATSDAADDAVADLISRWSEPVRRYHTLDHLRFMLAVVDDSAVCATDINAVRLAAWLHDAIYDPADLAPGSNERASADLAKTVLARLSVPAARIDEVARLILLTVDHRVALGDANGALLCDADLAILATDADHYRWYAEAIRAEYAQVPDDAFASGRSAVLAKLLDLDSIYHLAPHRDAWEARARANLSAELAALTAPRR
jgi:predicted metal-dependent HD superfamily phosphohydrolase